MSVYINACCLLLIVGFAVTAAIWPREVVSCRDFILCAVATFWTMLLDGIYPGRASVLDKAVLWLAEPGGPWHPTFAPGKNLSVLQAQSIGLPSIFLRAQPCCSYKSRAIVKFQLL